ncbi:MULTISPECIES: glycosyltransferase family 39 protein [unclassified Nocardia]|uniref:ArnT family glycosyltransferase n=1 Tax=unclassified Nocardia TaxID=2637762 RepID=UPI001CE44C83|nr:MULTISPECIES: glycosyltransferase family 39 protein [unclassified Nocardia]
MTDITAGLRQPGRSRTAEEYRDIPEIAWGPILLVAGAVGTALLVASRDYGYFFDEAYFVVAGRDHLSWGYFDQPPLVPALAALMDRIAPGSLLVLRLPATMAAVGGMIGTALIAREFGGGRGAQSLAAFAYACSICVTLTHWLATYSMDPVCWVLLIWLIVRWTRLNAEGCADDRLLLYTGLITAVSLQIKYLVPALWVALFITALVFGPRRMLGRPALWLGAAVAVAATVPNLIWQQRNNWPYTHMSEVVAAEFPGLGRFLWDSAAGAGLAVGLPLVAVGLAALLLVPRWRPYRFVAAALILVFLGYLVMHGRSYYVCGLYAAPLAAGAVIVTGLCRRVSIRAVVATAVAAGTVLFVAAIPMYPRSVAERLPDTDVIMTARGFVQSDTVVGDFSDTVVAAYDSLPAEVKPHIAIVAESYPFAAIVDLYRGKTGLPRAYSPHRGYYYFGTPPETATAILYLGTPTPTLTAAFTSSETVTPDLATLLVGRKTPWTTLWPQLRAQ